MIIVIIIHKKVYYNYYHCIVCMTYNHSDNIVLCIHSILYYIVKIGLKLYYSVSLLVLQMKKMNVLIKILK